MKNAFLCIVLALTCGLLHGAWLLNAAEYSAMEVLVSYSLGHFKITGTGLIELTVSFFPYILFQIVEGTTVFKYFCIAGVYIFSRCRNRSAWFLGEAAKIFLVALVYSIVWYGSGFLIVQVRGTLIMEQGVMGIFAYQVLIMALWLFFITLLINLVAFWFGSHIGTCAGVALQLFCVGVLLLWKDEGVLSLLPETEGLSLHIFLLKCDPVSHLFLAWHSVSNAELNAHIDLYEAGLRLYESIIYMGVLALLAVAVGCVLIKKVDFISENRRY